MSAAAERATREIEAHRTRALEILQRPAFSSGFLFTDPGAVEHDLQEARSELGSALTVFGRTDWKAAG
jgi:hypothetical protein